MEAHHMIFGAPDQLAWLQLGQMRHIRVDPSPFRSQSLTPSRPAVGHGKFGQIDRACGLLFGPSAIGVADDAFVAGVALDFGCGHEPATTYRSPLICSNLSSGAPVIACITAISTKLY
jgi:hypothetical protein